MNREYELNLVLELEGEAARWRRRSMFLLSLLLHGLLVLTLVVEPEIFRRSARLLGIVTEPARKQEATFLVLPPDLVKPQPPPKTNILSDKNRRAEGPSPTVNPEGLTMPFLRGNSPLPEIAGGSTPPPLPPRPVAPPAPSGAGDSHTPGTTLAPPVRQESKLQLNDVPAPSGSGGEGRLPLSTPGQEIQQSLQAAARGRAAGVFPGAGDSVNQLNNPNSNFSTEGPIILSDTQGVDFGPYLARVVYVVRRNWYAVIPESARLGQKGRVAIVFEILKDGSIPEIRLVSSSGAEPLDRAALASIRASNPFPPLPTEFTGKHLVLQFIYLYNLGYGY